MTDLNQSELKAQIIKNHTYGSITTSYQGQDRDIFDTLAFRTENPIITVTLDSTAEFTLDKNGQYTRTLTGSMQGYSPSNSTEIDQRVLRRVKFSDLTGYYWFFGYERQARLFGYIYTESFKRTFSGGYDNTSITITDTYYPETFIFQAENPIAGEGDQVIYKITTDLDTIKSCMAAAKARKGNQRIVVNVPITTNGGSSGSNSYEFTTVTFANYDGTDVIQAMSTIGDQGYMLLLSATEGESSLIVQSGVVDLSDYYTKEETNTKLGGYALKDSVKQSDWNTSDSNDVSFIQNKPTKLSQFTNDKNFATLPILEKDINTGSSSGSLAEHPISAFYDHGHSANRLAFLPNENIVCEETTDGGTTWTYKTVSNLSDFFTKDKVLALPEDQSEKVTTKCGLRFTITAFRYSIPEGVSGVDVIDYWNSDHVVSVERYLRLRNIICKVNSGVNKVLVSIETRSGVPGSTWNVIASDTPIKGSPQLNVISHKPVWFGGSKSQVSNPWSYRITLMAGLGDNKTEVEGPIDVRNVSGHGDSVWITEKDNSYISTGYLYDFDTNKNVTFPANLKARNILVDSPRLTNAQSVSVSGETSKLYSGASLTSLTVAAAKTANSQNGAEEVFQFSTGASPVITIAGVSWANSDVPTFEANKTYEIHIMYNSTLDKFLATYATYE